jgi:membrane-associated phospholipid phosphatase
MIGHAAGLRRLDGIIWAIVAAVAGIMLAAPLLSKFHLVGQSFLAAGGTTALFLLGYWFYETRRPDPRLSGALGSTAQLLAFAAVGAPLSYIGAIPNLPLQDRWFDVADHALGFDFFALLAWMDAHAAIHPLFWFSYFSLMPQTVIAIVALSFAGQLVWLRTFMLAFLITTLVTIAVAAIVPTEGAWGFYKLNATAYPDIVPALQGVHLPVFRGLRDGSFRDLMAVGAQGIINFPSLHAALGLLLTAALWPLPVLRWIGFVLNVLMIVSIPVEGGHYITDVLAGLGIAVVCLLAARAIVAWQATPVGAAANLEVAPVPARVAAPSR